MSWFYVGRRAKICTVSNNLERGKKMLEIQIGTIVKVWYSSGPAIVAEFAGMRDGYYTVKGDVGRYAYIEIVEG